MKEFIIFVCTDSTEIFFSKLRSAGLNYNLPSFFTDSYCAGVSNKHCLLTFSLGSLLHHKAIKCYTWIVWIGYQNRKKKLQRNHKFSISSMQCINAKKKYVSSVFALDYFEDTITLQNMHMYILTIVTFLDSYNVSYYDNNVHSGLFIVYTNTFKFHFRHQKAKRFRILKHTH